MRTHDYHGAAAIADRIALIEGGRILQVGGSTSCSPIRATPIVGTLLGSPRMARFAAIVQDGVLAAEGLERPLGRTGRQGATRQGGCRALAGRRGSLRSPRPAITRPRSMQPIFAGMDQAIQVQAGRHLFRKVVGLDARFRQGDQCWFRLPPERIFMFDADTGARIPTAIRRSEDEE